MRGKKKIKGLGGGGGGGGRVDQRVKRYVLIFSVGNGKKGWGGLNCGAQQFLSLERERERTRK